MIELPTQTGEVHVHLNDSSRLYGNGQSNRLTLFR
jgi:hypothetical protein